MEAPPGKGTGEQLDQAIYEHIRAHYRPKSDESEGWVCINCGSDILQAELYISLHALEFGDLCGGPGLVANVNLPYCPTCEGEPRQTQTCVHVEYELIRPLIRHRGVPPC